MPMISCKTKAQYTSNNEQKRAIYEWDKQLKMFDDYASKLDRHVGINISILLCMKSHDHHIFMEHLLLIAIIGLLNHIWKPIIELSQFFKDLCLETLWENELIQMKVNILLILCKLKWKFLPNFFNIIEHLLIHLLFEAQDKGLI